LYDREVGNGKARAKARAKDKAKGREAAESQAAMVSRRARGMI
jgi:hypothetical protein